MCVCVVFFVGAKLCVVHSTLYFVVKKLCVFHAAPPLPSPSASKQTQVTEQQENELTVSGGSSVLSSNSGVEAEEKEMPIMDRRMQMDKICQI